MGFSGIFRVKILEDHVSLSTSCRVTCGVALSSGSGPQAVLPFLQQHAVIFGPAECFQAVYSRKGTASLRNVLGRMHLLGQLSSETGATAVSAVLRSHK